MKITRRPAKDSDKAWVKEMHHESYHDVVVARWGVFDLVKADGYFNETWAAGGIDIVLSDDKPCGFVVIEKHPDHFRVQEIALRRAFWGQGIGTFLLREALDEADKKGVPVKLNVMPQNKALNLYKRLGFVECGSNDTHTFMERAAS